LTAADIDLFLDEHNSKRSKVALGEVGSFPQAKRMPRLVWNKDLAYLAELNTKQCAMVRMF
jgi:hypothetical protein